MPRSQDPSDPADPSRVSHIHKSEVLAAKTRLKPVVEFGTHRVGICLLLEALRLRRPAANVPAASTTALFVRHIKA